MSARDVVDWIKQTQPWPGPIDPSEALFGALVTRAPQELRDLYDRRALMAVTSGERYPSARIRLVAPAEWVIEITGGLITILHATARSVALLVPEPGSDDDGWGNLRPAASRLAEVLWWYRVTKAGRPPRFPDNEREDAIAESLLQGSLLFFLGHECGHLLIDLGGEQEFARDPGLWPTRSVQQRAEFLADELSLRLIMELCPIDAAGVEEQRYYGAAELGLQTWGLMESVGFWFGRSHPPTSQRVDLLRTAAIGIATGRQIRRHPARPLSVPDIGHLAATLSNIIGRLGEEILTGEGTTAFREELVDQLDGFLETNVTTPAADLPAAVALIFAANGLADPPDLLWAAARLAARRADILAGVDELARTLTDGEILVERAKQELLLRCIDLLLPPRGSADFLPLLREALSAARRENT